MEYTNIARGKLGGFVCLFVGFSFVLVLFIGVFLQNVTTKNLRKSCWRWVWVFTAGLLPPWEGFYIDLTLIEPWEADFIIWWKPDSFGGWFLLPLVRVVCKIFHSHKTRDVELCFSIDVSWVEGVGNNDSVSYTTALADFKRLEEVC